MDGVDFSLSLHRGSSASSSSGLRGLRGASRVEDSRNEVLQQVKQEREKRKYERMLPRAAIQVQKTFRAWRVRQELKSQLHARLDDALSSVADRAMQLDEMLYSICPLVFALYLPFDYRDPDRCSAEMYLAESAEQNLCIFLGLFHKQIAYTGDDVSLYSLHDIATEKDLQNYVDDMLHCTKKMVLLCSGILGSLEGVDGDSSSMVARCAAARILFVLSDETFWAQACSLETRSGRRVEGSVIFATLMEWWVSKPCVATATARFWKIIQSSKGLENDTLVKTAVANACQSQIHVCTSLEGNMENACTAAFVEHIMVIPRILQYSTKIMSSMVHLPLLRSIASVVCNDMVDCESTTGCAHVLMNFTLAVRPALRECVMTDLHDPIFTSFFSTVSRRIRQGDMALTEHDFDQLRAGSTVKMFYTGFPAIHDFVGLYYNITCALAPGNSILGYISCDSGILLSLWREISLQLGVPELVHSQTVMPLVERSLRSIAREMRALFYIFTSSYSEYIRYIDDTEFRGSPVLTLGHHRAIAAAMNGMLFYTFVPSDQDVGHYREELDTHDVRFIPDMKNAISALIRTLFEKNERCAFCDSDMWVLPYKEAIRKRHGNGLDSKSILNAFENMEVNDHRGDLPGILSLLFVAPSSVAFSARVDIFRTGLVSADRTARGYHLSPAQGGTPPVRISVHRSRLLEDMLSQVGGSNLGLLKRPLSVTFISKDGLQEAGIDMGGLTKELLTLAMKEICDPNRGILCATSRDGSLYPSPLASSALGEDGALELLQLAGALLGKALYENFLIQVPFATFFIGRLLGNMPSVDDLESLDPQLYRNLLQLKQYPREVVDNLGLYFTAEMDILGSHVEEELIPNGSQEMVTYENRVRYISLLADWHLRKRLDTASKAFMKGLSAIFPPSWLRIFSPKEINMLLGGGKDGHIDIKDWKKHCRVTGGYTDKSRPIKLFWKVVASMDQETIRQLLKFATATTAAPLGGFKYMNPPFTVQQAASDLVHPAMGLFGGSKERLPSASTCSNTLRLPPYMREKIMREKLLYAIRSDAGFDLS
ncbi:hypothetical protein M9435_006083 [Picochlorum sp. BPE23]|nr:hypothetical protein M9435_006083 [Picochlorum sp. BPE23]